MYTSDSSTTRSISHYQRCKQLTIVLQTQPPPPPNPFGELQVFNHSSRKIVSATTPSSGFALGNDCPGDVSTTTAINSADDNFVEDGGNGNPGSSVLLTLSRAGNNVGGGDDFGDGFAGSMERVGTDSDAGTQVGVLSGRHGRHAVSPHNTRQERPRRHHDGKEGEGIARTAVSTARSFYDRSEIALRSRRLCIAYGGGEDGDGGEGSVSPRLADTIRPTKVRGDRRCG